MKAIFICDNKDEWGIYSNLFKAHYPKIELTCKLNLRDVARHIAEQGPPLFTIIDSLIKEESLENVFHEVCMLTERRPIIFIEPAPPVQKRFPIDFFEINFANSFIKRPLKIELFKKSVNKVIKAIHSEMMKLSSVELDRESCLPVKVRNFYRFKKVPYDVYLELSETKFTKIINKNEPYNEGLIQKYIQKKVRFFYLEKKDHLQFLEKSLVSLLKILHTPRIAKESVLSAQISSVAIIHEYIRTIGVSDHIILLTKKLIDKTFRVYRDCRDLINVLKIYPFQDRDLSEQAVLTMYVCEAILNDMGWGNDIMRSKLGLASIIHDCLLINDDLHKVTSLNDPNLEMFSEEEQEEYKVHAMNTAEVALYFSGFPETEFIIIQHHELPNGEGFPQGLNSHQITALSCVFIIANNFVAGLAQGKLSKTNINKILKEFTEIYDVGNFKKPLASLKKFFQNM
ncbi:MAG: hypothetical protein KAG61_09085 [Bacteriovoracaceae bacterium]|nr:hypothetical protein [Bacteriovoracaceae bacterium]